MNNDPRSLNQKALRIREIFKDFHKRLYGLRKKQLQEMKDLDRKLADERIAVIKKKIKEQR